ncbi:MAG: hypothetical protein COB02_10560 [Candidatus Cloacimonadota bacterium]|nr:MAG: hypothetical protein COB02_10560 [Candidatus Cloacimonadota bacterium]
MQFYLSFILLCIFNNSIPASQFSNVSFKKISEFYKIYRAYSPDCQRFSKKKKVSQITLNSCANLKNQLQKSVRKIQLKSNVKLKSILSERQKLYLNQDLNKNLAQYLTKLSKQYQQQLSQKHDNLSQALNHFHHQVDTRLKSELYTYNQSHQILQKRFDLLYRGINDTLLNNNIEILFNSSKYFLSPQQSSFISSYQFPYGKDLFNFISHSNISSKHILIASIQKNQTQINAPKSYNNNQNITQLIKEYSLNGPKKVTVSSWRQKANVSKPAFFKKEKKISLQDEFSSIFLSSKKTESILNTTPLISNSKLFAFVQLPILLSFHPEMKRFDNKSKRFINDNPQIFINEHFFQGFSKKLLNQTINSHSFEEISELQKLESTKLMSFLESENHLKAIHQDIQKAISQLTNKHQFKAIFYDNLILSNSDSILNHNKIIVNKNIQDLTKEALIILYQNDDQQTLNQVLKALADSQLLDI